MPSGVTPPVGRSLPSLDALVLAPFPGVRFDPTLAGDLDAVTAPAPAGLDPATRRRLEHGAEHSVLRLIIPRERSERVAEHARRAAALAEEWLGSGVLRADEVPALYAYEATDAATGAARLRGFLGALAVTAGPVVPHERTSPGPVAERLALLRAGALEVEPLVVLHTGGAEAGTDGSRVISAVLDQVRSTPAQTAVTRDGLTHRVWPVREADTLDRIAGALRPRRGVIADGHHRWQTHLRDLAEHGTASGGGSALALLVDADLEPPELLAVHRVVRGLDPGAAARRLAAVGTVRAEPAGVPPAGGAVRFGQGSRTWSFAPAGARGLAVDVLSGVVLPRLGVDELRDVEYEVSAQRARERAARDGGTAFLLPAPDLKTVLARAVSGRLLPPTSTSFVPKPLTGLVMREPGRE